MLPSSHHLVGLPLICTNLTVLILNFRPAKAYHRAVKQRDDAIKALQRACTSSNYDSSKAGKLQEITDIETALPPCRLYFGRETSITVGTSGKGLVRAAEMKVQILREQVFFKDIIISILIFHNSIESSMNH